MFSGATTAMRKLIQELILPELESIKAKVENLGVEIRRLDEKIEGTKAELLSEIRRLDEKIEVNYKRLDEKIDSVFYRLDEKITGLRAETSLNYQRLEEKIELAIDIHERLAALEARVPMRV
ncbi:MAG: hypothetical protein AB1630_11170 [bacterium]